MATNNGEASTSMLTIHLELGGGTELLTSNKKQKKHTLSLPSHVRRNELSRNADDAAAVLDGSAAATPTDTSKHATTMFDFMQFVCRDLIVERHGMLVETDGSIRPGILVLINDADWELEGEMEYELKDGDQICLISTLHGG